MAFLFLSSFVVAPAGAADLESFAWAEQDARLLATAHGHTCDDLPGSTTAEGATTDLTAMDPGYLCATAGELRTRGWSGIDADVSGPSTEDARVEEVLDGMLADLDVGIRHADARGDRSEANRLREVRDVFDPPFHVRLSVREPRQAPAAVVVVFHEAPTLAQKANAATLAETVLRGACCGARSPTRHLDLPAMSLVLRYDHLPEDLPPGADVVPAGAQDEVPEIVDLLGDLAAGTLLDGPVLVTLHDVNATPTLHLPARGRLVISQESR